MKWIVVALSIIAALGVGFVLGWLIRSDRSDSRAERRTAIADAQEVIGAYNNEPQNGTLVIFGNGNDTVAVHLAATRNVAPSIWRFLVKKNGRRSYGCIQVNLKQYWHGQESSFHGVGFGLDPQECKP